MTPPNIADATAINISGTESAPRASPTDSALIDLAFGDLSRQVESLADRHLALLPPEALELDLSDPAQRQLGDYELLELIGEGGMGVVYRARQSGLDREVAVKLLAAGPWASEEFIERFRREAQNAARMQHPNIVAIYEVGSAEELHFFSMRLIHGASLASVIKQRGRMHARRAVTLLQTVAEAVDYAHRLGVLHLDLKPANVLIDEYGNPHVADFGLARRLEQGLAAENDEISGTPSYMAPEQAIAGPQRITQATDVWGLGAILYELVTGKPPFRGTSAQGTLKLVVEGRLAPPRYHVPDLPIDLQAIILRCMVPDSAARYASARELADDLSRFLEGREVHARPLNAPQRVARWVRREPRLAAATAFAFLALLTGLVAATVQWHHAKGNALLAEHNADLAQRTLWSSREEAAQREIAAGNAYPALGNAVENLAEMEAGGDRDDAALERLRIGTVLANAPQLINIISPSNIKTGIETLAISPDAKSVAVATYSRTVRLFDLASGRERWHVDTNNRSFGMIDIHNYPIGEMRFSADGRRLVVFTLDGSPGGAQSTMRPHYVDSVLIDVRAGRVVQPPESFADFLASDYADDGRYALLFDKSGRVQRWRTLPWTPDGDLVALSENLNNAVHAGPLLGEALLPDSGNPVILVGNANLKFRTFDAEHLHPLRTLTLDSSQGRATAWALRHDGKQLAIGTVTGQIALWDLDSGATAWLQPQLSGRLALLRYSQADSRLIAVSNAPSELRIFDPRDHALVAEPVKLGAGNAPNVESGIDGQFGSDARTLLTRYWGSNATLWRLPAPGFPLRPPVPIVPVMVGNATRFALSTDARSRLMVTSDNNQIKIWRLRPASLMDRTAAPMVSDTLRFDGTHLVSFEANRVSVFDVATGRSVGMPVRLPQAPSFAGLSNDATHLIAVAGRQLSCWNWHDAQACWPPIDLPDSPLRLSLAANAPVMAISTGSNRDGRFLENIHLVDLETGRQRGKPVVLRGPLGTLRLSADGRRLLAWQDSQSRDPEANVLYVIDATTATIAQRLAHPGVRNKQVILYAAFRKDAGILSNSGPVWDSIGENEAYTWHWNHAGQLESRTEIDDNWSSLLPMPNTSGWIALANAQLNTDAGKNVVLSAPDSNQRVNVGAVSADAKLLALGTINGVALTDIPHNQRLLPDFSLPLPNDETVQQLAFAPDGSRLVGRTTSGHWFQWPLVTDKRPVAAIKRDISEHDFRQRDRAPPVITRAELKQLRTADPGPAPVESESVAGAPSSPIELPAADPRYQPLDLDPIANIDPRETMDHATRLPPQPQSLPSLPRGLQRYDGIDFLLGRAVQLSGTPQNLLDAAFPATSTRLSIGARKVAFVDTLVMQYLANLNTVGSVHLRYADGAERRLDIRSPRDVREHWMDAAKDPYPLRIGWLGSFAQQLMIDGPNANSEETLSRTFIVRLRNPRPDRRVVSMSLSAPATASPGLLFLAITLEPLDAAH